MEPSRPPAATPSGPWGPSLDVQPPSRPGWVLAVALAAMAVTYVGAFWLEVVPFWPSIMAFSALSWWAAWHPYLPVRLRPTRQLVALGLAVGAVLWMVSFAVVMVARQTPLWPPLAPSVAGLGELTGAAPGWLAALLIVTVTSPSEEVLFRGAVFARCARRLGPGWRAVVAAAGVYALLIAMSGNPLLPVAGLVCGTVWGGLRMRTGSLVPGVVAHAVWSASMLAALPVLTG
jgi:membrane protease YdiL (CAAX protease family)